MTSARAIVADSGDIRHGYNGTGSTISALRLVIKSTTVDSIAPATDGTAPIDGVTMAEVLNGYTGDVQHNNRGKVEAGEAIAIGEPVTGGTDGKGFVAAAGEYILGYAATAADDDGDVIEVDIQRGQLDS
jgi:hypothetical protein